MDLLAEAKSEKFSAIKSYPSEGRFYHLIFHSCHGVENKNLSLCVARFSHDVTICVALHISYCITSNYVYVLVSSNQMFRRGKDLVVGFRSYRGEFGEPNWN